MQSFAIFGIFALLISNGVECGFASAGSSSSSASDGSGHTYTQTNNNGQGTFSHTSTKPGGGGFTQQSGPLPNNPNYGQPGFAGNIPNFAQPGFGGFNYGPAYPYGPFGAAPVYNPIPQPTFGYNPSFQPFQPFGPFQQPLATPQEFSSYLNSLQQQYAAYYKQQQELLNAWKSSPFQSGYGGVPNYAYASGAFGPNGVHQTAGVFPPNKNKPNLDTRFDGSENAAGISPSAFFGVQTSSFSSSSDINGVKKHKEGASTTINDNGKVSTYSVEN